MNSESIIINNNIKLSKKHTMSTKKYVSLRFRIVTSYNVFLLIITMLFMYPCASVSKNAQTQFERQTTSAFIGNVKLFEKDLDIMAAYCHQLLQNTSVRALSNMDENDKDFTKLGLSPSVDISADPYPKNFLPVSEIYCYLPNSGYVLAPDCFVPLEKYYRQLKQYPDNGYDEWLKALSSPSNHFHFIPMTTLAGKINKNYVYVINTNCLSYDLDTNVIMCFIYEDEQLSSLFECMSADSSCHYLSVQDQTGTILSLSADANTDFDYLISEDNLYNDMSIFAYTSDNTEFTYYFAYPMFSSNFALSIFCDSLDWWFYTNIHIGKTKCEACY